MENQNQPQNIHLNSTQINNNNNRNIIISTNGITSEQTKMIEYFVMFQKFMNFSPEINKPVIISNENNNKEENNIQENNKIDNKKDKNEDNKEKERKWNPIKRKKSKTYEQNIINKEIIKENNNNNGNNIKTNYENQYQNKINNEKQQNNIELNNYTNNNENMKINIDNNSTEINNDKNNDIKEEKKVINFDDIPIKVNNNILINNYIENMPISKINTKSTQINKNINTFQNIDDIIIKPVNSNFIELVEKNLNNNNYKNQINKCTNINIKHEPDSKKIQNMEKNIKREKIKLNKEKAKEIEKNNIHNIIINQNKKEKNKNSKTIPISKSKSEYEHLSTIKKKKKKLKI